VPVVELLLDELLNELPDPVLNDELLDDEMMLLLDEPADTPLLDE